MLPRHFVFGLPALLFEGGLFVTCARELCLHSAVRLSITKVTDTVEGKKGGGATGSVTQSHPNPVI